MTTSVLYSAALELSFFPVQMTQTVDDVMLPTLGPIFTLMRVYDDSAMLACHQWYSVALAKAAESTR